jgi:hypothetical protein
MVQTKLEASLNTRERRKLREARKKGYLDGRGPRRRHKEIANLSMVFSLWCWRLRLPVVWCERHSPRSRYGRVRLDLYTTRNRLSLRALAENGPRSGALEQCAARRSGSLAGRAMKAAVKPANQESAAPRWIQVEPRKPAKLIELPKPQTATA